VVCLQIEDAPVAAAAYLLCTTIMHQFMQSTDHPEGPLIFLHV
jgi:hypothetical protein